MTMSVKMGLLLLFKLLSFLLSQITQKQCGKRVYQVSFPGNNIHIGPVLGGFDLGLIKNLSPVLSNILALEEDMVYGFLLILA